MDAENGDASSTLLPVSLSPVAVRVKDGRKCYVESKPVLQGVNMTVPTGGIYGLLGASGCGKTTLLSCIVGLQKLDSGSIKIFGRPRKSKELQIPGRTVGFMAQDIALYYYLTIDETMKFFGKIYGMSESEVEEKMNYLGDLLQIPGGHRRVGTLSGGQKRRVSLTVALLHSPRLIILDEPTVGVDSVIRHSIWNYLGVLCAEGRTVIITTHYIEEAGNADKVGLMGNGRLMAEDSPFELYDRYNVRSLEEVMMAISKRSKAHEWASSKEILKRQMQLEKNSQNKDDEDENYINWKGSGFRGMLWKNVAHITRSPADILFYIGIPVICVISIYLSFGNPPRSLPVGVVNAEMTDNVTCGLHPYECPSGDLSCHFLSELDSNMVSLTPFDTVTEAVEAVRRGESWGVINIGRNFSSNLQSRLRKGLKASLDDITGAEIGLTFDMTNQQVVLFVYRMVMESFNTFSDKLMEACEILPDAAKFPISIGDPVYGSEHFSFREFVLPAIVIFASCTLVQHYSATPYVNEKKAGVLDRLYICGLSTKTMFLANILIQSILMTVILLVSIAVAHLGFGFPIHGSIFLVTFILVLQGIGSVAVGNIMSLLIDNETVLIELIISLFIALIVLCGVFWPIESMNPYMYAVTLALPYTLPLRSCRVIFSHGWGIDHPSVWPGFVSAVVWDVVLYAFLFLAIDRKATGRTKRKSDTLLRRIFCRS